MNNQNNGKSKTRNQGNAPVRNRAPKQGSQSGKKNPQPKAKVNPGQTFRNKPDRSGAGYDVQFDAISKMPNPDVRSEPFDENIATITGTSAFGTTSYPINPGQAVTFPRLSKIAALYERYRFKRLEFYFLHDVSQYASQGQTGLVLLNVLFDSASAAPTSKVQIEATNPRVICMPNQNSLLRVPVRQLHPKGEPLYLRPGQLPGGSDIKTYDAGNLFATVQGMVGTGEVGELHVRGEVEFMDFLLDSSLTAAPANNQVAVFQSTAGESLTSTVPYTLLFAGAQIGSLGITNSSGILTLPAGNFLVTLTGQTNFTGLATKLALSLLQNSVGLITNTNTFTSGTMTAMSDSLSYFVTSNGGATSAIQVQNTSTFSTGTGTAYATLVITAV